MRRVSRASTLRFLSGALAVMAIVIAMIAAVAVAAQTALQFRDDFSAYAAGSGGEPQWNATDIGFSVQHDANSSDKNGKAMLAEVPGGHGFAVLKAVPAGRALTLEAVVTPREALGHEWKTAGIGLYLNADNFWHLALAEAPDAQGKRHFVELSEMMDGVWNAHSAEPNRLAVQEESGNFEWRFNQPYRLRLTLARDRISGEVFEGEGLRYRCVRLLDKPAVTLGWPMLADGGFTISFDDVHAEVNEVANAAELAKLAPALTPPPFISSASHKGSSKSASSKGALSKGAQPGFFRTQLKGNTWWLLDPNGQPTLSIGTDHVNYNAHWAEKLGYAPYHRNVEKKYGSEAAWAKAEVGRLLAWNFNVLGAGGSRVARYQGLAHTEFLSFGADFSSTAALVPKTTWTGWPDVFDPRFARFCELRARERCAPNRNDSWLLGYFLDNELEWWGKAGKQWGLAEEAWKLPAERAGKKALVASLRRFYHDDSTAFNKDFASGLKSFDELLALQEPRPPLTPHAQRALMAFVAEAAARYFQVTTAAVRQYDANHLILGCRFAHDAPEAAWRAAGQTCDVVTVNMYPRVDMEREVVLGLEEHLHLRFDLCRKPIILTEWSFPALDAKDTEGHALPSKHGAGMRVDTQQQKAHCYAIFQRRLFALPFVVGSHYFMWSDEPALGISSTFPEDSNYGLVSETDEPYKELTATATRVNAQVYDIHAGKVKMAKVPTASVLPVSASKLANPQALVWAKPEYRPTLERTANGYIIQNGVLRLMKEEPDGDAFDHVQWRGVEQGTNGEWIELGSYSPVLYEVVAGQNIWVHPDRVTNLRVREQNATRLIMDITFEKTLKARTEKEAAGGQTITEVDKNGQRAPLQVEAQPYRCAYRLTFEAGQPYFLAQCLWVENSGPQAWLWRGYYHYPLSRIGSEIKDDEVGGPGVPNYWLSFGAWRDSALKIDYGIVPLRSDDRLNINFWQDEAGHEHPDCHRPLEIELQPGQRWQPNVPEPVVAVFGLRETQSQPRPWVGLMQQLESKEPKAQAQELKKGH